ncbi:hypothetical protein C8R45DRAFT_615516 [Mycena sanguinolenta]|nr:hypothetical protein C8R45DRAFT_615516 [Mycena sanguinolenta]
MEKYRCCSSILVDSSKYDHVTILYLSLGGLSREERYNLSCGGYYLWAVRFNILVISLEFFWCSFHDFSLRFTCWGGSSVSHKATSNPPVAEGYQIISAMSRIHCDSPKFPSRHRGVDWLEAGSGSKDHFKIGDSGRCVALDGYHSAGNGGDRLAWSRGSIWMSLSTPISSTGVGFVKRDLLHSTGFVEYSPARKPHPIGSSSRLWM